MNVKRKALLIVTGVILALSGFYLHQGIAQHNEGVEESILAEEQAIDALVADYEQNTYALYRVRLENLVEEHPELPRSFAARDRDRLYKACLPLFERRRAENPNLHAWDFNLPDGTVFLRVQDPDAHGDNIGESREMLRAVHERREPISGYDVGRHGAIYWVAQPVFHEGGYVGATEFGLPVEQLTKALARRFGTQVAVTVRTSSWNKATLAGSGYRQFGDQVLIAPADSRYLKIPEAVILGGEDRQVSLAAEEFILHTCAVLHDYRGRPIGNVLILQDITEQFEHKRRFVLSASLATGLLLAVSLAVLYASYGKLVGRLEVYAAETKNAKDELERSHDELDKRVQERTADLRAANSSLEEQRRFLQTILESLTHPFYVIDAATYRIVLANKAAFSARRDGADQTCYALTHGRTAPCTGLEHPCALQEVKRRKRPVVLEHAHGTNGVTSHTVQIFAYPVLDAADEVAQVIEYCIDVTERKEAEAAKASLERQLRQAQKMEAIGTLAGGIAHDFNNILAGIYGYAEILRYDLPQDPRVQENVKEILRAGDRAKDLVRHILAIGRQTEQERRPLYVHQILKEALKLLRASLPATIEVRERIAPCGPVLADPTQVHQVIMNLCTNAYQAMRDGGGILGVALSEIVVRDEDRKAELGILAPGRYARIEVSDTGCGMDGATLDKVFDPYFTTKKKGEGTGLGLAVVHGIVKAAGGHVSVYSEPGAGSTFNVYFPQCEKPADQRGLAGPDDIVPVDEPLAGGRERVLLVDDEEDVVKAVGAMLESLGYTVEAHRSSPEALRAFEERPGDFDVLLTDMTMPGLTGDKLAARVLKLKPGFPIVMCTGFSELVDGARAKAIGIREFVMKPVLKAELARVVRSALDTT